VFCPRSPVTVFPRRKNFLSELRCVRTGAMILSVFSAHGLPLLGLIAIANTFSARTLFVISPMAPEIG
jgi:hypothetical protein